MAVQSLHHFNICSSHDEVMVLCEFYRDIVGLIQGSRPPFRSAGFWMYAGENPVLHLTIAPASNTLPAVPERRSAASHIAFRCSDFDGTLTRLRLHDIPYRATEVPLTKELQIFFRDPSGVGVELIFPGS